MYRQILLPADGSPEAEHAATHAFELAGKYDAVLRVLAAADPETLGPSAREEAIIERLEADAREGVDDLIARAEENGVENATGTVVAEEPGDGILEHAEEHGIDTIVMGTRGRSGVDRYLSGRVTEGAVRSSDTPVLAVRISE